jgi:hypothetical protein
MSQENIDKSNGHIAGFYALAADAEAMIPALTGAMNLSTEQVQAFMGEQFPAMTQMLQGLPQMQDDFNALIGLMEANVEVFEEVPGGLAHNRASDRRRSRTGTRLTNRKPAPI